MPKAASFFQQVYTMVRKIPRGRVASYGQIAALIGKPRAARMVGWALHGLEDEAIPWQRVVNRHGIISTTCQEHNADEQAFLLQKEGVKVVKREGMWWVDLEKYLWEPK